MKHATPIRLAWDPHAEHPHRSDAMLLAPYANRPILIEVAENQVALILCDFEVVAALLPGAHQSVVGSLETGWARRQDQSSGRSEATDGDCHLSSSDSVLFLPTGTIPSIEWAPRSSSSAQISGAASASLIDPVRFYRSFFRHSEDLSATQLNEVLRCMVLEAVEQWLSIRGELAGLPLAVLADELRISIGASLAGVGLSFQTIQLRAHAKPSSPREDKRNEPVYS